jgi:hypothetical protein
MSSESLIFALVKWKMTNFCVVKRDLHAYIYMPSLQPAVNYSPANKNLGQLAKDWTSIVNSVKVKPVKQSNAFDVTILGHVFS